MKLTRGVRLATTVLVSQCNKILGVLDRQAPEDNMGRKIPKDESCNKFICVFFWFLFILILLKKRALMRTGLW